MDDFKWGNKDESGMDYFMREGYKKPSPEAAPTGTPTEIKLELINRKLARIANLLEISIEISRKDIVSIPYDSGTITLPNAITIVPDPTNITPTTGYTQVPVWRRKTPNQNAQILHFVCVGPGSTFVRSSTDGTSFSETELEVFRGDHKIFNNVYELRVRTNVADTKFIATENEQVPGLIIQAVAQSDRNPTIIQIRFFGVAGPHGEAVRWSYTVPAMRKAFINNAFSFLRIVTVAAPAGFRLSQIFADLNPVLGPPVVPSADRAFLTFAFLGENDNTIGNHADRNISDAGFLIAGLTIIATTHDVSTGGTVGYDLTALITEFDV